MVLPRRGGDAAGRADGIDAYPAVALLNPVTVEPSATYSRQVRALVLMTLVCLVAAVAPTASATVPSGAVTSISLRQSGGFVAHDDRVVVDRRRPALLRRLARLVPARIPHAHSLPACADCLVERLTIMRDGRRFVIEWNNSDAPPSLRRLAAALQPLLRPRG